MIFLVVGVSGFITMLLSNRPFVNGRGFMCVNGVCFVSIDDIFAIRLMVSCIGIIVR